MRALLRKFFIVCALIASDCQAVELISDREFFIDNSSNKTLAEISTEPFTRYSGVLNKGYTKGAIWIRLEITPPREALPNDDIIIRIRPVFLDEIRLFDPLDQSSSVRVAGDTTPIQSAEYPSLSHTFVIPAGHGARKIWLRLKTTSTSLITVEALSREEMVTSELNLNLVYFISLTILAMFVLFILINWTNQRELLYLLFVVRQFLFLGYTASLFGLHRYLLQNLPANVLDHLFSWIVIGATLASFTFEWKFLKEYSPNRWGRISLNGLLVWSGIVILLMIFDKTYEALKLNMILNAVGLVVLLAVASLMLEKRDSATTTDIPLLNKRLIIGYYATLNVILIFSVLPLLGVVKGTEFTLTGLVFYAICSSLIMTGLMQLRIRKQQKIHAEYANKLLLSEHRIAIERNKREEQTHLFRMLMHEIKNPLAVVDMALLANNDQRTTNAYVSRAVNSIKEVLDRCFKADRLSDGNINVELTKIKLAEFLDELFQRKSWGNNTFQINVKASYAVHADLQLLGVAMSNLIDNAIRYGDPRAPIDIEARLQANKSGINGVAIVVSNRPGAASWPDTGKVFKKYYRSPGAESQSGTGLGLYLVRTLANLMHGECNYVPDDKNIRFELWLPT